MAVRRLNLELARQIRAEWKEEMRLQAGTSFSPAPLRKQMAERYNVSEYTLRQVLIGKTWREPDQ